MEKKATYLFLRQEAAALIPLSHESLVLLSFLTLHLISSCKNSVLTVIHFWYGHTREKISLKHSVGPPSSDIWSISSALTWLSSSCGDHIQSGTMRFSFKSSYQFRVWMFCHQTNILKKHTEIHIIGLYVKYKGYSKRLKKKWVFFLHPLWRIRYLVK